MGSAGPAADGGEGLVGATMIGARAAAAPTPSAEAPSPDPAIEEAERASTLARRAAWCKANIPWRFPKSLQEKLRLTSDLGRLNQKGRSEILHRVNREELREGRARRLGRDVEADRERAAQEIKRELFRFSRLPESPSRTEAPSIGGGGDPDLEVACAELEAAISKIPTTRGDEEEQRGGDRWPSGGRDTSQLWPLDGGPVWAFMAGR